MAGKPTIPTGAIVAVDADCRRDGRAAVSPRMIFVPNAKQSVDGVSVTKSAVIAAIYDNVRGRAYSFTPGSRRTGRRPGWALPDNASVDLVTSDEHSDDAFFSVASYLTPTTLWQADAASAKGRAGQGGAGQVRCRYRSRHRAVRGDLERWHEDPVLSSRTVRV